MRTRPLTSTLWLAVLCLTVPQPAAAQLRSALEVRSLNYTNAEAGQPVDLTGVVIFADPPSTVFVQDRTAGTFFQLLGRTPPAPGDELRVRGITYPGLYLPGIREADFSVLRHVGLPEGVPASYDDLASGRYHYQRVAVDGVVRTVTPDEEGASVMRLAVGSRVVEIRVGQPPSTASAEVDSRVQVLGLAAGHINDRRQLVEPYVRCRNWLDIRTLQPARVATNVALVSPQELLTFDVEGQGGHRVRVQGSVLGVFPNGECFLRAAEAALRVLLPNAENVAVGDRVEVIGFPEMEQFSASIVDASLLQHEPSTKPPTPLPVSCEQLLKGSFDADLVAVEATLSEWYRSPNGAVLKLRDGARTLQVLAPEWPEPLTAGARVRVTGICRVETTRRSQYRSTPESVSLQARSAADIALLRAPAWWNSARLATALLILAIAIVFAGLWIALLRRQVVRQTGLLRRRIENEAALEERQRIAREFHDTLEQDLAGLSLRLDAAVARSADDKLRGFITGSRSLVSRIQSETRNLVADLRDTGVDAAGLDLALRELAARQPDELGPEIRLHVDPVPPPAPHAVHHLKMIAREAVTNAIKHASARHVDLTVTAGPGELIMSIRDDGRGFDAAAATHGSSGHFGCMGIRERCRKLGATVTWTSSTERGTTVEVRLPQARPQDA